MAAFADGPGGGNPAGVVLDAAGLTDGEMLALAAEVGYAETAFVTEGPGGSHATLRYFSPIAEVPFCGHATIATAVVLAGLVGPGRTRFATPAGPFDIETRNGPDGVVAAFTSVEPRVEPIDKQVLGRLLAVLGLQREDLASDHPPRLSFAGNTHPVLVIEDGAVFDGLGFEATTLRALMVEQEWLGTVTVLHRLGALEYEARNPFPVGAIVEDPATGSAAASTGAYLRALGLLVPPTRIRIQQGRHVGRPSLLLVDVPASGGITVTGTATPIAD